MKSKGFTLLELLVVIAILGVLVVGLMAGMGMAKKKAFDTKALSCAHTIRTNEERVRTVDGDFTGFSDLGHIEPCSDITPTGNSSEEEADVLSAASGGRPGRNVQLLPDV